MLPEKSQGKVLQATVVAVGPGSVNQVIHLSDSCIWLIYLLDFHHLTVCCSMLYSTGCIGPQISE